MRRDIIDRLWIIIIGSFKGVDVHIEPIEQDFATPCFVISNEKEEFIKMTGNKYGYSSTFKIMYYPSSNEPNLECLRMSEFLHEELEFIYINSEKIVGSNFLSEIKDNVLTFKCDYNTIVYEK